MYLYYLYCRYNNKISVKMCLNWFLGSGCACEGRSQRRDGFGGVFTAEAKGPAAAASHFPLPIF